MFETLSEVFGKVTHDYGLKYEVLRSTDKYEIRNYAPFLVAQTTIDLSKMKDCSAFPYFIMAEYAGESKKPPKNSMSEKMGIPSPVLTKGVGDLMTLQMLLPHRYKTLDEVPKPLDERVELKEEPEKKYGVMTFSGFVMSVKDQVVDEKAKELRSYLERDGYKIVGPHVLARYNPPWTLSFLRKNELMMPVE